MAECLRNFHDSLTKMAEGTGAPMCVYVSFLLLLFLGTAEGLPFWQKRFFFLLLYIYFKTKASEGWIAFASFFFRK